MPNGEGGQQQAAGKPKSQSKSRKEISYTVLMAEGGKDADPKELSFKVVDTVQAVTPTAAKEKVLNANDRLQKLVNDGRCWLEASSKWAPKQPGVEQPPPKFTGL